MSNKSHMTPNEMREAIKVLEGEEHGAHARFARRIGATPVSVSRWLHKIHPVDETTAILIRLMVTLKKEKWRATYKPVGKKVEDLF